MKIDELEKKYPTLKNVISRIKETDKIENLFPPQEEAIKSGYLGGKNLVLAVPTCSGKTLISELAMLKTILEEGKKAIYIVPLKALASEKYDEFKEKYGPLGIRVAVSTGDFDSSDTWLQNFDIIILTSEKLDSLLRHGIQWLNSVGLCVVDEVHLLDSPERGPTLEVTITRLRQSSNPKIIALSATINNYQELAEWLQAEAIKSDFRPVKLYKGICFNKKVKFMPKKTLKLYSKDSLFELIAKTLSQEKQSLVFINTRKGTESAAEKIGKHIEKTLTHEEKTKLLKISKRILNTLEHTTKQCERLANCIKAGTSFHHAGLVSSQRKIIEENFKNGTIKVITATPTLSYGLNLPSHQVIIRDIKRFSSFRGMDYIPILDIEQMAGRAGRLKYDKEGQAIIMAKTKAEAIHAWDNYINGEPERITSKLGVEPVLRMHILALISSGVTPTRKDLRDFFSKTFHSYQYRDQEQLNLILEKVLTQLTDFGFIQGTKPKTDSGFQTATELLGQENQELKPTLIGKRVSELYIDPLTANKLIQNLNRANTRPPREIGYLQTISNTIEMHPLLSIRKGDMEKINNALVKEEDSFLDKVPNPWDIEYEDYLRSVKTALMFLNWCDEMGEDLILENFNVTPGELRARLSNADWLLYSLQELALLLNHKDLLKEIRKLRLRVKHGIKKELLPLIRLKGIGRKRARLLYNYNMKTLDDLRKAPILTLERILESKILAERIKEQLGETNEKTKNIFTKRA